MLFPGGNYTFFGAVVNEELRAALVQKAFSFPQAGCKAYARFATACFYYQHALRFVSPHQIHVSPQHFYSEIIVNLAKCVEIFFTKERDKVRTMCKQLGYSNDEIRSQIIPVYLIRNELDGAHPVGTRMSAETIVVLKKYVERSLRNIGELVQRVGLKCQEDPDFLPPLGEQVPDGKQKLCAQINGYLNAAPLYKDSHTRVLSTE